VLELMSISDKSEAEEKMRVSKVTWLRNLYGVVSGRRWARLPGSPGCCRVEGWRVGRCFGCVCGLRRWMAGGCWVLATGWEGLAWLWVHRKVPHGGGPANLSVMEQAVLWGVVQLLLVLHAGQKGRPLLTADSTCCSGARRSDAGPLWPSLTATPLRPGWVLQVFGVRIKGKGCGGWHPRAKLLEACGYDPEEAKAIAIKLTPTGEQCLGTAGACVGWAAGGATTAGQAPAWFGQRQRHCVLSDAASPPLCCVALCSGGECKEAAAAAPGGYDSRAGV
jgi:hypothetical protein